MDKKLDIPQAPKREWKKKNSNEDEDFVFRRSTRGKVKEGESEEGRGKRSSSSLDSFVEGDEWSDDEYDEERNKEIDSKVAKVLFFPALSLFYTIWIILIN